MRIVFSSLVAASLLMHAMLGCCWHHAHAAMCSDEAAAVELDGCGHEHHDGDCEDEHGQPAHAPCQGHSHCHGLCNYLPVQKTQIDKVQLDSPVDFVAVAAPKCDVLVAALPSTKLVHESAAGLPLRLHLLYQILLI